MKKLVKTLAFMLCLVLAPCTFLLTGCGNKEEAPAEITVKDYISNEVAWSVYREAFFKAKSHLLDGYNNLTVNFVQQKLNGNLFEMNAKLLKTENILASQDAMSEKTKEGQIVGSSSSLAFKYNDEIYEYDITEGNCSASSITEAQMLVDLDSFFGNAFVKSDVVIGKVLTNGDYVITLLHNFEEDEESEWKNVSQEITFSSGLLVKKINVVIREKESNVVGTTTTTFTYGAISEAEMQALIEEAKSHIA